MNTPAKETTSLAIYFFTQCKNPDERVQGSLPFWTYGMDTRGKLYKKYRRLFTRPDSG